MLLNNETTAMLKGLAPRVLFHGTRFLVPILLHDELALSVTTGLVYLTACPQEAAAHADVGPRPFDDGRGAIIVLDRDRLEAEMPDLYQVDETTTHICELGIHPLSNYICGVFWLDELAPGTGLHARLTPTGPLELPALPYMEMQVRFWARLDNYMSRGEQLPALKVLYEVYEAGMYGLTGPSGLERSVADAPWAPFLPGVRFSFANAPAIPPFAS